MAYDPRSGLNTDSEHHRSGASSSQVRMSWPVLGNSFIPGATDMPFSEVALFALD
jgi:hypothetical protein